MVPNPAVSMLPDYLRDCAPVFYQWAWCHPNDAVNAHSLGLIGKGYAEKVDSQNVFRWFYHWNNLQVIRRLPTANPLRVEFRALRGVSCFRNSYARWACTSIKSSLVGQASWVHLCNVSRWFHLSRMSQAVLHTHSVMDWTRYSGNTKQPWLSIKTDGT